MDRDGEGGARKVGCVWGGAGRRGLERRRPTNEWGGRRGEGVAGENLLGHDETASNLVAISGIWNPWLKPGFFVKPISPLTMKLSPKTEEHNQTTQL